VIVLQATVLAAAGVSLLFWQFKSWGYYCDVKMRSTGFCV